MDWRFGLLISSTINLHTDKNTTTSPFDYFTLPTFQKHRDQSVKSKDEETRVGMYQRGWLDPSKHQEEYDDFIKRGILLEEDVPERPNIGNKRGLD